MMLSIENLSFSYGKKEILKNVSLTLNVGDFCAILGPSGCGKTTLFRLIVGLEMLEKGRLVLEEQNLSYLSQENTLLPWRTILANILLPTEISSKASRKELALYIIDQVGLTGHEKAYPHELSGGMKQRVALARALIQQRSFLLLDEPFSSLDYFAKQEFYALLKKLKKDHGLTILLITHDLHEAKALADSMYFIVDGTLIGPRKDVNDMQLQSYYKSPQHRLT
ncbi:MAG: ABC transporter ATP-binding protein [Simkaniaceae bacterium]|nr:ABC transporter ATP-binding protein [Simkaniaceae bacterium]